MNEQYPKGILVMDFLQELGLNMITIGKAIDDTKIEQSYQIITSNPQITKKEFLTQMEIEEYKD